MKKYKIVALGASGSGKTVFLASMFKALSIQSEHGFYIELPDFRSSKRLNDIYTEIVTGEVWPKGTRYSEISEWAFSCKVKSPALSNFPVCQFSYFDYAGGRLTDAQEDNIEFETIVSSADIILGLIDGQKVLALMEGNRSPLVKTLLEKDLPSMIQWMKGKNLPIHLILTKWDLIQGKYSLGKIKQRLLQEQEFESLVYDLNRNSLPIRLIPISSVGKDFSNLAADGSMTKKRGVIPFPFQIEAPIACILPDQFQTTLLELANHRGRLESLPVGSFFPNTLSRLSELMPLGSNMLIEGLFEIIEASFWIKMSKPLFERLAGSIIDSLGLETRSLEALKQERAKSLQKVTDQETALRHAVECFLYIQLKLERDFPESKMIILN
jgi:GTPase SAR1 family protein